MASSSSRRTYYSAQAMQTWFRPGMDVGDAYGFFEEFMAPSTGLPPQQTTELFSGGQETGLDAAAAAAATQGMIGSIIGAVGKVFTAIPAIMGMAQAPKTREHELALATLGLKATREETRGLAHQADIAAAEAEGMATSVSYLAGGLVIAVAIGGATYTMAQKRKG